MARTSPAAEKFFDSPSPIAIAHRGGDSAGWKKRNTMAAFKSAYSLGYRYFETDVIKVKSGEVVVAHGAKNSLTAKMRGTFSYQVLKNLTYPEIRQKLKVGGQPIPTLKELLAAFPDTKFIIDPKTDQTVEPLAKLLISTNNSQRCLVGSFHQKRVEELKQLIGPGKVVTKITVGKVSGLLRLAAHWFRQALRISGQYHPAQIDVYEVPQWFITRSMVIEAHREGKFLTAWTPNNRRQIERLIKKGVDGVISDRAVLLKNTLIKHQPQNHSLRS